MTSEQIKSNKECMHYEANKPVGIFTKNKTSDKAHFLHDQKKKKINQSNFRKKSGQRIKCSKSYSAFSQG